VTPLGTLELETVRYRLARHARQSAERLTDEGHYAAAAASLALADEPHPEDRR